MENNNSFADYKKNRGLIILIAIAGMTIYLLPYFRYYYYDAFLVYFNIDDMQMGILGSVYGTLAIVGYCLGGWVADRFPLRHIVSGSLIITSSSMLSNFSRSKTIRSPMKMDSPYRSSLASFSRSVKRESRLSRFWHSDPRARAYWRYRVQG